MHPSTFGNCFNGLKTINRNYTIKNDKDYPTKHTIILMAKLINNRGLNLMEMLKKCVTIIKEIPTHL